MWRVTSEEGEALIDEFSDDSTTDKSEKRSATK